MEFERLTKRNRKSDISDMKILVLGATGRTGKWLVAEALSQGYEVHVLVREPAKLRTSSSKLTVFTGTPADEQALEQAIIGCTAVLSALNISRQSDFPWSKLRTPPQFLSGTIKVLIPLCHRHEIKRVVVISAWGVHETRKELPGWFRWLIDHSNIRFAYRDHEAQEDLLRASGLDWTAVRPAGLTNAKKVQEIQVSLNGQPRPRLTISRRSVARFMVDLLRHHTFLHQAPVISAR